MVEKPEYCNGMQMKKCQKACGTCEGEGESPPPEPENECTETFEPVCAPCRPDDDCDGMTYKIETRGEGQMGKFGCTYPKSYEFVNSGTGCPACTDVTCEYTLTGGKAYK